MCGEGGEGGACLIGGRCGGCEGLTEECYAGGVWGESCHYCL